MHKSGKLAKLLVLTSLMTFAWQTTQPATSAPAVKDYTNGVRLGGWLGNNPLIILPDRSANAVKIGNSWGGVKLVGVDEAGSTFTIDYGGKQLKGNIDPAWQIAAHPDLTNWLISYMNVLGKKLDAQNPDITQEGVIRVYANGKAPSGYMKVEQANPFETLPEYLESVDLKIKMNPHQLTEVEFASMKITPAAYERLSHSPYEKMLNSVSSATDNGAK